MMTELAPEIDAKLDGQHSKELAKNVALGFDVQNWLRSPMAIELCSRAEERRETLVKKLVACDTHTPAGVARNTELRFEIAVIDHWQDGLAAIVNEGDVAAKDLVAHLEG